MSQTFTTMKMLLLNFHGQISTISRMKRDMVPLEKIRIIFFFLRNLFYEEGFRNFDRPKTDYKLHLDFVVAQSFVTKMIYYLDSRLARAHLALNALSESGVEFIVAIDLPISSIIGAIRSVTPTRSKDIASRRQAVATMVHRARGGSSSGSTSSSSGLMTGSTLRRLCLRFLRGRWYLSWSWSTFSGPLKVSSSSSATFNAT